MGGRPTLGRLFSVLGATIDAYVGTEEELSASSILDSYKITRLVSDVFTTLSKNLFDPRTKISQLGQLESLGFVLMLGVGSEIVKKAGGEFEVMSFSNVSSEASNLLWKSKIVEYRD